MDGHLIRELPPDERPRERLLAGGATALSDAELLALLLRTGSRGASSLSLARGVLAALGGLDGLAATSIEGLKRKGVGSAKAATVVAALELGRRLARAAVPLDDPLSRPEAVARYLALRFDVRGQEVLGALFLDGRHRLLGESEIFRGTIDRAAAEPAALLRQAIVRGATGLVLFHTHPSGDPTPSVDDLAFTGRLADGAKLLGLQVLDHLILGHGGRWLSLRQHGVPQGAW
jgi:DNA repair protein RadC